MPGGGRVIDCDHHLYLVDRRVFRILHEPIDDATACTVLENAERLMLYYSILLCKLRRGKGGLCASSREVPQACPCPCHRLHPFGNVKLT